MNFSYPYWLLIISLSIPSSASYSIGVAVPTVAAVIAKTAGSLAAYTAVDFLELITQGKTKAVKVSLSKSTSSTVSPAATQINEIEQPIFPLIITAVAFLGIVAWHIKMNKQLPGKDKTDAQELAAEKA